jgi:hypothetical protein
MTLNIQYEDQFSADGNGQRSITPSSETYQDMLRNLAKSKDEILASLEQQVQEL